ncbi:peptidylprolyl isomerase [Sandaracinobacter sp. RS1-74]|uniref:peptidylprolyl isomerase n=1 Tax=Sandaracinobacteroides sayramensis TaxID=2913411 RepID=UPI001EDB8BDB|nr:peptidylprolyl isomerase [Sandaracinobacteroides sayramensis]MCG2840034.1 peptidylprolyl isomerase [Sandaracinobacteroides sayramensis]
MKAAIVAALLVAASSAATQSMPTPGEILASAPAADWQAVPAEDLLLLEFAGNRTLAIQLAPAFAPGHIANIRKLVADGWFERNAAIVRVQENYVVQWGDPSEKAPLPAGLIPSPDDGYERAGEAPGYHPLPYRDAYASSIGHAGGWPIAADGKAHWLPHCPAMLGVGRNMAPDTGSGAELYVVIGHGPRHLDRNIALVGRVLEGMENISALPRGTGPLGMYEKPEQRVPLVQARFAGSLPPAERPHFEVLKSESASFARWIQARANRKDAFFIGPAGGADLCNLMPPVRRSDQLK